MSKRLLVVNLVLAGVAVFFAVALVRNLTHARSLPPPPAPRQAPAALPAAPQGAASAIAGENLADYNVIVAKHLFNPSRTEAGAAAAAAPPAPPPPKPLLLGVVVDGARSRAYLEDPASKRVFGYQIGDTVSGGRLETITNDKVVIVRPDGPMDVMLRDPSNPKPAAPPAAAASAPPAAATPPSAPARPPSTVAAPPAAATPPSAAARPPSAVTAPSGAATPPGSAGSQVEDTTIGRAIGRGRAIGGRR